jgi:hypothetical protein
MKYKFTHLTEAEVDGVSLQGYIYTTYSKLLRAFGQPDVGPNAQTDDTISCVWRLGFEDSIVLTIYDEGLGFTPNDEFDWRIGGYDSSVIRRVQDIVLEKR